MVMFPEIHGENLEGQAFRIPFDLKMDINLIIIAFKRYQQFIINQWVLNLDNLQRKYPIFEYYELPILASRNKPMRFWIDGGMRAGIPDKKTRERTITVYMNKNQFRSQLNIKNEDEIQIILMTKQGEIIWRESGGYSEIKFKELHDIILEKSS
jgi:hypothetical protein